MGRMKNFAIEIEENDNEYYMAHMLGITLKEFQMLTYEIKGDRIDFIRTLVFDLTKSPVEILSKIKDLKDGNTATLSVFENFKL